jgi:hypothetical protein
MERLEINANPRTPEAGERILPKAIKASAIHFDRTRIRPLKTRHNHEKGGFARSRRPDETGCLTAPDFQRDPF